MYQEEAICNREIYKNAEINVLKLRNFSSCSEKQPSSGFVWDPRIKRPQGVLDPRERQKQLKLPVRVSLQYC
jgi:hypothetical protein